MRNFIDSQIRNLAAAVLAINDYLRESYVDDTEESIIKEILADINNIEEYAVNSTNTFQQNTNGYTEALTLEQQYELVTKYKSTLEYVQKLVISLRIKIKNIFSQSSFFSFNFKRLKNFILVCLDGLETKTKEMMKLQDNLLLTVYQNVVLIYAAFHGGSYLPLFQYLDPLTGKTLKYHDSWADESGHCYGYVKNWATQINTKGRCTVLPKRDTETFSYQLTQYHYSYCGYWTISNKNDEKNILIYNIVNELCNQMTFEYCYGISIYFEGNDIGHALGVRRIPNSDCIEFIDANAVLVTFPNQTAFKFWFVMHMVSSYPTTNVIILQKLDTQPENATTSLKTKSKTAPLLLGFCFVFSTEIKKIEQQYKTAQRINTAKEIFHANILLVGFYHHHYGSHDEHIQKALGMFWKNIEPPAKTKIKKPPIAAKIAVCTLIKKEIDRLNNFKCELNIQKIAALSKLINIILTAAPLVMLKTAIAIWGLKKAPYTKMTYAEIITAPDEKQPGTPVINTKTLISHLCELEICEPILKPLHENLLEVIKKLVTQNWTSKVGFFGWGGGIAVGSGWVVPHTIAAIRNVVLVKSNDHARTMLEKVKDICVKRQSQGGNNELYKRLAAIDTNNPHHLTETTIQVAAYKDRNFSASRSAPVMRHTI